jgi:3-oxosteroid 1-dehydrogenase
VKPSDGLGSSGGFPLGYVQKEKSMRAFSFDMVVVGSGFSGLVAALAARSRGATTVVLEKSPMIGGASAASGGQVWVPANHLMMAAGESDSVQAGLEYVASGAGRAEDFDRDLALEWLNAAPVAARWLEESGAVTWSQIQGYPDYRYPGAPGSVPTGRYLTSAQLDGSVLGASREELQPGPHFPVGVTYDEAAGLGRSPEGRQAFAALLKARRAYDQLTHGQGLVASAVAALDADILVSTRVVELLTDEGGVIGVRCDGADGPREFRGSVLLATGAHDYDTALSPADLRGEHGGSLAPASLTGDAMRLVRQIGGDVVGMDPSAEVRVPGYRVSAPEWDGDDGTRGCWEQSLPHCFIVDRTGRRFCDDSHRPAVAAAVLAQQPSEHLPMYLIWDSEHHRRYGLGSTPPGGRYPDGLVTRATTLRELGVMLGVDPHELERTASRFNVHAATGEDPDFGRGSNTMGRFFRGDRQHPVHPNTAPVQAAPFFGMPLRLVATGIGNVGVRVGSHGQVLDGSGAPVRGLYAAGAAAGRTMFGTGYNSGYSLSQGMSLGYLAALHAAARTS